MNEDPTEKLIRRVQQYGDDQTCSGNDHNESTGTMTKAKRMTKTITITMTIAMTKVLCRELKAENERLKARMGKGDVSEEELKDMAGKEVIHRFQNIPQQSNQLSEKKV